MRVTQWATAAVCLLVAVGAGLADDAVVLKGHKQLSRGVAWSTDGKTLASAGDSTIRLWDPVAGQEAGALSGHSGAIKAVAWSPDGKSIAHGGFYGEAHVWSVPEVK